jgi:manganese/zinc/iron transport system permease protein
MSASQIEIQLIGAVTAAACALPGVFLILRRMALMSDAISHSILLGIVLAFFVVQDLASPWLVLAAALTGLVTVSLVELLGRTRLVKEDAAIGMVFPVLFSLGIILISRFAGNVHLDTDAVLLGELAFAPFDRFVALGYDLGPKALWVMGIILLVNLAFIRALYKELKLATFDAGLAAALGFAPALVHYGLMSVVSITAVGAFQAVGSVLVVGLMIAPPAAAYLLTDRLPRMLVMSVCFGAVSAIAGCWLAYTLDTSIVGAMATTTGILFGLAWLLAPERGLLALVLRRSRQRMQFAQTMLTIHLLNHEGHPEAEAESRVDEIDRHLRWGPAFTGQVVQQAERHGLVVRQNSCLTLTERGRELARETIVA